MSNLSQFLADKNGLVLLATLTPTAAANLDFLSTFSSTYDNYLIIGNGIVGAANDSLYFRFANAGTSDTGSNYRRTSSSGNMAAAVTALPVASVESGGLGCSFAMAVRNANSTSKLKGVEVNAGSQSGASTYAAELNFCAYTAANAISGIRFYWNGGSNFTATGSVRVYGIANT